MKKTVSIIAATVASAALLMGAAIIGWQDWQKRATPGSNPASGYLRMWADSAAGNFKCITSAGAACYFDSATSGTVTSVATTSPLGGGTITGTGTLTCATCTVTVASGTSALGTSAIASGACASVVTTSATGTSSTDTIMFTPNASIKAVTGYTASTSGGLTVAAYPTTNNVNFDVCNWSNASITPGAVTLNFRVVR